MARSVVLGMVLVGSGPVMAQGAGLAEDARLPTRARLLSIASEAMHEPPKGFRWPERVDLRPYLPPPGDQGRQNACIAWTLAYGLKSFQEGLARGPRSMDSIGVFDARTTFSPAFPYNLSKAEFDTTDATCMGTFFDEVFSIMVEKGCCSWEQFPYDTARLECFRPVPDQLMPVASRHAMATPLRVSTDDIPMIRYHLARNEPVAFAMGIDTAFKYGGLRAGKVGTRLDWRPGCAQAMPGSHAMLLVGYDDRDSTFLVMNSWGQRWGAGGYCHLRYEVFACHATEAYIASDAPEGMWPAVPLLVPGHKPMDGGKARMKLTMGQAMKFNDLTVGVAHLSAPEGRVRVHLSDTSGTVQVRRIDLVEDRPVQFLRGDTLVRLEYTKTSRAKDPRRARAHLEVRVDPDGRDKALERALDQAARIRSAREAYEEER